MDFRSTREVANMLDVDAKKLSAALWVGGIKPLPERAPSGAFLWTPEDIEKASWVLRQKSAADVLPTTENLIPEMVDIKGLCKISSDWHNSFVSQFKGIPVRIDDLLENGQYYISISSELYKKLKAETPSPVPIGAPESPVEA